MASQAKLQMLRMSPAESSSVADHCFVSLPFCPISGQILLVAVVIGTILRIGLLIRSG